MDAIDPSRLDLAREFKRNPLGPHSPDLQKLLKLLRWEPISGRFLVVQPERDGPWYLARTTGPKGHPLEIFRARGYADLASAWWAVFRARFEQHTGVLPVVDPDDATSPTAGQVEVTLEAASRPLLAYADQFSVVAGEPVAFKVSAIGGDAYHARIVRLRSADHLGVGLHQTPIGSSVDGSYPARGQAIHAGSWVDVGHLDAPRALAVQAWVWPTTAGRRRQAVAGTWDPTTHRGWALVIDPEAGVALVLGDGEREHVVGTGIVPLERHWYLIAASLDSETGEVWVGQRPLVRYARGDTTAESTASIGAQVELAGHLRLAAWSEHARGDTPYGSPAAGGHYNGKLEAPRVAGRALTADERRAIVDHAVEADTANADLARYDLGLGISGTRVDDVSGHQRHGVTVNLPTRAMKGRLWDGTDHVWTHRPEHYGAIHFHDDDLYDCGWETDFTWQVPADLPSGLYCAHLTMGATEDWVPFVVRPPRGTATAPLALVLPTASYWAYGNRHSDIEWRERENVRGVFVSVDPSALYLHEHPELGVSMYDEHADGSGVCLASRLRPVLSLRPREQLWQLPADTHIIDWLEAKGLAFDVITEDDVDAEGAELLCRYRCVLTGTHPEYPSRNVLDAIAAFQNGGGRFVYMGGNGFYWRVSYHPDLPGVIEMRRAEDGIRSWLAEGGEYYHAFTGELGGMWRRMGRAPQSVAGAGMTAQGFDRSTYYERTAASHDPRASFIFEGIGADERIGDFGLIGGGAAGWEIDRADPSLGTPPHALVVATATRFSSAYHWMKEELTHTHSAITGETCPHVHCDMVFYETPNGGAVFSTSSIAFAGALSHRDYDNNVSRLLENVVRRFLDPKPL
ncbi:MAG: N,N-dimethylformamidase [Ectothiorhodospiraceae bacterium]|nr:N,N-dimethylformamidase [Ectothiorhodospiraceae bacterium]